jgi:hypothetical protein
MGWLALPHIISYRGGPGNGRVAFQSNLLNRP